MIRFFAGMGSSDPPRRFTSILYSIKIILHLAKLNFQKGINLVKILYAIFYDPPGFEIYIKKLVVHNVRVLLVELKP